MVSQEIQEKFLNALKEEVNPRSFNSWFRPLKLLRIEGGQVELAVPSSFFADWLKENYMGLLKGKMEALLGHRVELTFTVVPQIQASLPLEARPIPADRPELNPRYTFESFVVGPSNQLAHAASLAVAERPAEAYNPLFIYGGVGLGKTHLLNAIGHKMLEVEGRRIYYLSSEAFTNQLINSIRLDRMTQFRERFRGCDALLIDDIQFLSGKERTQEEFFHTFNALYESGKQIVISSDRTPKEIPALEERVRSRFEWGLIADIQPPETETKVAIIKKKAEVEGVQLPDEVAFFLASSINTNIRELEGALIRLGAISSLTRRPISLSMAQEVLKDLVADSTRPVSMAQIVKVVADFYNLKVADLKSNRRLKAIAHARQVAMYLARQLTNSSFPDIGREFGDKDHSTVIHSVRKVEAQIRKDARFKKEVEGLMASLK